MKNARDRNTAYLRELLAEPDIIETDYPSEFVDCLVRAGRFTLCGLRVAQPFAKMILR